MSAESVGSSDGLSTGGMAPSPMVAPVEDCRSLTLLKSGLVLSLASSDKISLWMSSVAWRNVLTACPIVLANEGMPLAPKSNK